MPLLQVLGNTPQKKKKLSRFDRQAGKIFGSNFNVNMENMIHKHTGEAVKKCISGEICENFTNYFEVNDHNKGIARSK